MNSEISAVKSLDQITSQAKLFSSLVTLGFDKINGTATLRRIAKKSTKAM